VINRFNVPTLLTLVRLGSPLILPLILVYFLPFNLLWVNVVLAVIFMLFGFTDFLDGYLARKYGQITVIGRLLDPVADKFLLYSTLVALLTAGKVNFYWVLILIGREFFIMGLRIIALEQKFYVPVSYLGKVKTTLQMMILGFIILNPYQQLGFTHALWWNSTEMFLLLMAVLFSLLSAKTYCDVFMRQLDGKLLPFKRFHKGG